MIGRLHGSSDSPIWKRGWRSFSSWITRYPRRCSNVAAVESGWTAADDEHVAIEGVCCFAHAVLSATSAGERYVTVAPRSTPPKLPARASSVRHIAYSAPAFESGRVVRAPLRSFWSLISSCSRWRLRADASGSRTSPRSFWRLCCCGRRCAGAASPPACFGSRSRSPSRRLLSTGRGNSRSTSCRSWSMQRCAICSLARSRTATSH